MNTHATKKCSCCQEVLPAVDFGANRQTPDGLSYYCKACATDKHAAWIAKNPGKAATIRAKYLTRVRAGNEQRRTRHNTGE